MMFPVRLRCRQSMGMMPSASGRQAKNCLLYTSHRYPVQLSRMLGYALESERAAIQKYQRQTEMIRDENIQENLCRIILDEEAHVKFLSYLKEKYA